MLRVASLECALLVSVLLALLLALLSDLPALLLSDNNQRVNKNQKNIVKEAATLKATTSIISTSQ